MKSKDIKDYLLNGAELIKTSDIFGTSFHIQCVKGGDYKINITQFSKFKEICKNKENPRITKIHGHSTSFHYWM